MNNVRLDRKLDAAVNKGLAAARLIDIPAAIKIMSDEGVPPEIIERVLRAPQQRRSSDWM